MKLYYIQYDIPDFLQKFFFKDAAKFVIKKKDKANFQLLLDYTSSLLVVYNGKTEKLTSRIAGYRNERIKLNLPENSYVHILKFKPEVFFVLNNGNIKNFKNNLCSFSGIKFADSLKSDKEIIKTISDYFKKKKLDLSVVKKYLTDSINAIASGSGMVKVDELVHNSGVSARQFQREFKKVTGFSPKEFSSLARINSLTIELVKDNVSLGDIFFNFGFYDQAHFNKEFKKIIGANPSLFESRQKLIKYFNLPK